MSEIMLQRLWEFADNLAEEAACSGADAFCDIGLMLQRPPITWDYDATPVNSVTFASTGGDGVHFSLLDSSEPPDGYSPVVMTVPMAFGTFGSQNVIVGRDLPDFLALGCISGYFALEQLAYEREDTIAALASGDQHIFGLEECTARLLDRLRQEFSLEPWTDVAERLALLQDEFGHVVQYGDDYMLLHDESPKRRLVVTNVGPSKMQVIRIIKRLRTISSAEALELIRSGNFTLAEDTKLALKPLAEELKTLGATYEFQDI